METVTTTGDVIRDVVPDGWSRLRHRVLDLLIDYGTLIALVALFAYFALTTPYFLTADNLVNIGRFAAVGGILAAAFTFALITSQVDLTLGPAVSVAAITYAVLSERNDQPVLLAVAITLGLSVAIGLANGVLVVDLGVNSFIGTLAMSLFLTGLGLVIPGTTSQSIFLSEHSAGLHDFATARVLGLPVPLLLMIGVYLLFWVVLTFARLGAHVYAAGDNPGAALRAGIPVTRLYRLAFVVTGLACGVSALILVGQANYASSAPGVGTGGSLTLTVLASVLIGGMDFTGGSGRIERTLVGVLLVAVLSNGLVLNGQDVYMQYMLTGMVFVLAVLLSSVARKRKAR
jgi:ribose/xylose/arabinose/galactoside ABC-type transport system permease subunit